MGELNHTDDLFKQKLTGAEAGSYSEASWEGAAALLDRHYRLLFWKRTAVAASLISALVVAALLLWPSQVEHRVPVQTNGQGAPEKTAQDFALTPSSTSIATENSEGQREASKAKPTNNHALVNQADASEANTPNATFNQKENNPHNHHSLGTLETVTNDLKAGSIQREAPSKSSGLNEDTKQNGLKLLATQDQASEHTRSAFALMPIFSVDLLGAGGESRIASRLAVKGAPYSLNAARIEVQLGLGGVFATGITSAKEPQYLGGYASTSLSYRLRNKIIGRSGLIVHYRGVAFDQFASTGEGVEQIKGFTYVDVPIEVGYQLGARHRFLFGMAFSKRMGVHTNQVFTDLPVSTFSAPDGASSAFSEIDLAGLLTYQIQLTSRLFAQGQMRYGFFDLSDDDVFKGVAVDERNHQIRIGLNYRLLSR
jgi:hypothetical protein